MGKIVDFFRRDRSARVPSATFEELFERVRPHCRRALRLVKSDQSSASYVGGSPVLPDGIEWPSKNGKRLAFLACIDLSDVAATGVVPWLPGGGQLLFFYDIENQPWGFDPNDRGSWSVVYITEGPAESVEDNGSLPRYSIRFVPFDSVPGWERMEALGIHMSDAESDYFYDSLSEKSEEDGEHQISGFPQPVQGDQMELEAQLASNGIYVGDSSGFESLEARRLEDGAKDWRLLLQFAGDDDLGVMWGDCGLLYFWVKQEEAQRGDFSNVWLILQCA